MDEHVGNLDDFRALKNKDKKCNTRESNKQNLFSVTGISSINALCTTSQLMIKMTKNMANMTSHLSQLRHSQTVINMEHMASTEYERYNWQKKESSS